MLCAYVICQRFFRTLFAFIGKITFIVTVFYVPTCSQNFYKFKGLLNAIKMTIILICNCITKRTHHIAGLKKSQSIYYSPPFLCCFNTFWMSPDYAWVFGFFIICKGHPHYLSFKDRLVASKAVWFIPCSYWWYCSPPFLLIFYLEVPGPVILIIWVIKRGRFNFAIGVGFVVHLFIIPSRVHFSPLSFYY